MLATRYAARVLAILDFCLSCYTKQESARVDASIENSTAVALLGFILSAATDWSKTCLLSATGMWAKRRQIEENLVGYLVTHRYFIS
jgi:hypothetical protein